MAQNNIRSIVTSFVLINLLTLSCVKEATCPNMGVEYTYANPGVVYSPGSDSIQLGTQIFVEAAVPKSFFDQEHNRMVTLTENSILGPLSISKAISSPYLSFAGAIEDVELTPILGTITKDSITFSQGLLLSFRTVHWAGHFVDSFKLNIGIKPTKRGTYFITLRDHGNRDQECALFKYLPTIKNSDQHFYLMTPITNGEISEIARNYVYCFKVY